MLKKCLKYDLRAIWKYWWIIAISTLGMSLVCGVSIRLLVEIFENIDYIDYNLFLVLPLALITAMCVIGIIVSFAATVILVVVRFYKHFYSDEGYLTFTLPVKRSTLFASKVINAGIWYCAHVVLIVLGLIMIFVLGIPAYAWKEILFADNIYLPSEVMPSLAFLVVSLIEYLVIGILTILLEILLLYFCVTLGSVIAKKGKVIAGIGVYYGVNAVVSFVTQIGSAILGSFVIDGAVAMLIDSPAWRAELTSVVALALLCVVIAVPVCVLYLVTLNLIERRLNLS